MEVSSYDCVVIGAGMSGLSAATTLRSAGYSVVVLEKAGNIGGRMQTREWRHTDGSFARCDTGAQLLFAQSEDFLAIARQWEARGLIRAWRGEANMGYLTTVQNNVFTSCAGMNALLKDWSTELDIELNAEANRLHIGESGLVCETAERSFTAASAIVTTPLPESLEFLDRSNIALSQSSRQQLEGIEYARSIVLVAVLEGTSSLPAPGGIRCVTGPALWICDGRGKGDSSELIPVVIQAQPYWSNAQWDAPDVQVAGLLMAAASDWFDGTILRFEIYHWERAYPTTTTAERALNLGATPPIILAGDAFGGPLIEGAFLSGQKAAREVIDQLSLQISSP